MHIIADILDKCTSRTIIPREKLFQITCEGKTAKQINTQPQWSSRNMQCPLCEYDMKKGTKYRRVKKKERHRKKTQQNDYEEEEEEATTATEANSKAAFYFATNNK